MKGKAICLSAALAAILSGCSTTPAPEPVEPFVLTPLQHERCYSMDVVERETAGRAYLEEGRQFYLHLDCDQHLMIQAEKDAAVAAEEAKSKHDAMTNTSGAGSQSGQKGQAQENREPSCYYDKMTAGRGDLPPCEWDEEAQEFILEWK